MVARKSTGPRYGLSLSLFGRSGSAGATLRGLPGGSDALLQTSLLTFLLLLSTAGVSSQSEAIRIAVPPKGTVKSSPVEVKPGDDAIVIRTLKGMANP